MQVIPFSPCSASIVRRGHSRALTRPNMTNPTAVRSHHQVKSARTCVGAGGYNVNAWVHYAAPTLMKMNLIKV